MPKQPTKIEKKVKVRAWAMLRGDGAIDTFRDNVVAIFYSKEKPNKDAVPVEITYKVSLLKRKKV